MFDLINEPQYPDWCSWLYGGNAQGKCISSITNHDIVGFVNIIKAIRSVGAQQIIVVEPGKAGGSNPQDAGWVNFEPTKITDPNILYSKDEYQNVISGNPTSWNGTWGVLLGHYPLYYGEWAVLPNPADPAHCQGLTSENADQITNTFLNYLRSLNASWTYWYFEPYHLVTDFTSYTPTSFQTPTPWTCPNATFAGAGLDIRRFLEGVKAIAANNVWAIGSYLLTGSPSRTLIEHWNGATWSVIPSPNIASRDNYLNGIVAISANNVWASETTNRSTARRLRMYRCPSSGTAPNGS